MTNRDGRSAAVGDCTHEDSELHVGEHGELNLRRCLDCDQVYEAFPEQEAPVGLAYERGESFPRQIAQ
jgi:hypothetical protein